MATVVEEFGLHCPGGGNFASFALVDGMRLINEGTAT